MIIAIAVLNLLLFFIHVAASIVIFYEKFSRKSNGFSSALASYAIFISFHFLYSFGGWMSFLVKIDISTVVIVFGITTKILTIASIIAIGRQVIRNVDKKDSEQTRKHS